MLTIKSHPVYRDKWVVVGPSPYEPGTETTRYGPDTLRACIEAKAAFWLVVGAE